jgi:hypothetical protein
MQIFDNVRSALRALRANKLIGLTMLGIIIGVSAVISLLSIGQGVEISSTSSSMRWARICCLFTQVEQLAGRAVRGAVCQQTT